MNAWIHVVDRNGNLRTLHLDQYTTLPEDEYEQTRAFFDYAQAVVCAEQLKLRRN